MSKKPLRIALIGNGPLSDTDRAEIRGYDYVVRFNDCKNYQQGEPAHALVLRVNSRGLNGLTEQGRLTAPVGHRIRDLFLVGRVTPETRQLVDDKFTDKRRVYLANMTGAANFSLSTGTRMIHHFLDLKRKGSKLSISVFGMNWNGKSRWHDFSWESTAVRDLADRGLVKIHPTPKTSYLP